MPLSAVESTITRTGARSIGRPSSFYPSPFFDISSTYLPRTIKETYDWCIYYQLTNPLINSVTQKLATYPITDLVYEHDNKALVDSYKTFFEKVVLLRTFLVETNLDRYTFGNSFVSVRFPFRKRLSCRKCKESVFVDETDYKWKDMQFNHTCKSCSYHGPSKVTDIPVKSLQQIKLIRWSPKHIDVRYNELTGISHYYYNIPRQLKNSVVLGKPDVIESIPQAFIEAVKRKKAILISRDKIFHAKRPSISRNPEDAGLGAPLLLPVLKDVFFLQILRKSQEAVALEHIVPMRVLFPQVTVDGANPYGQINLKDWQREVEHQIRSWRRDSNHIPVMPVPLGHQMIGGQGKSLLLHQEIRIYSDQIIAGMGVPTGFFYGEQQYSGANVNLRAMENEFLGNRQDMLRLVEFIRDQVCSFMGWAKINMQFRPFKMADDIQRSAFDLQLVGQKMLSKKTFMQTRNFDYRSEVKLMDEESKKDSQVQRDMTISNAEAQGEASVIMAKYQAQAQAIQQEAMQAMQPQQVGPDGQPVQGDQQQQQQQQQGQQQGQMEEQVPPQEGQQQGAPEAMGGESPINAQNMAQGGSAIDMFSQANGMVRQLKAMDEATRYKYMAEMKRSNPELYGLINKSLHMAGVKPLRPLPLFKPPRAEPQNAQV